MFVRSGGYVSNISVGFHSCVFVLFWKDRYAAIMFLCLSAAAGMFPTLAKVSIFGIKPSTSCFHPWNQTFCILGLVAGDTVLGRVLETLEHAVVPASRSEPGFAFLRLLQRLLGALPLVHVDYACDALHPLREAPLRRRPVPLRRRLLDHPRHRRPLRRGFPHLDVFRG